MTTEPLISPVMEESRSGGQEVRRPSAKVPGVASTNSKGSWQMLHTHRKWEVNGKRAPWCSIQEVCLHVSGIVQWGSYVGVTHTSTVVCNSKPGHQTRLWWNWSLLCHYSIFPATHNVCLLLVQCSNGLDVLQKHTARMCSKILIFFNAWEGSDILQLKMINIQKKMTTQDFANGH